MKKLMHASLAGLLLAVASCQSDQEDLAPVTTQATEDFIQEEAYPGLTGKFEKLSINGEDVLAMHVEEEREYVLEGDMLIPQEAYDNGRTEAVGVIGRRWPNGVVYYRIASDMPDINRNRIRDAMAHWENYTNVRFVARTNQNNYVLFSPGSGCSATVGMVGGQQNIRLSTGCGFGNTVHEIGHCLGLYHEHTRLNRDEHINIAFDNIQEGKENNFVRADLRTNDVRDWAGNMSYSSIMMYSSYSFSKNGNRTITRKDGKTYTAQRNALSSTDIEGINKMYPQ